MLALQAELRQFGKSIPIGELLIRSPPLAATGQGGVIRATLTSPCSRHLTKPDAPLYNRRTPETSP